MLTPCHMCGLQSHSVVTFLFCGLLPLSCRSSGTPPMENSMWIPTKIKMELLRDLAINLLNIYTKYLKLGSLGAISTPKIIAALFTIAQNVEMTPNVH